MANTKSTLYAAFKAKDTRFDGRFFVGISTTGIYCRPVCKAKQPKPENCTFYSTAAEAEQAGYRPCLLCRPELAPGASITDATASLAYRAARMLEESCSSEQSLAELAGRLGCTDRHLRRAFSAAYNVSPSQYLQTCRLLMAKSLLTDTGLPVLDVAMATGFGSLRRFNDLFKIKYNMTPTALRRQAKKKNLHNEITLALGYRPPYRWEKILSFFAARAIKGVELVTKSEYSRTVCLETKAGEKLYGWLRVNHWPQKNALRVTVSDNLLPVLPQVLARLKRLFDLHCEPNVVYETLQTMNKINADFCILGTRVPGCFDAFEMSVRAVLGQQITIKAASTLTARIVEAYGKPIQTNIEGLTHIFPSPEDIIALGEDVRKHLGVLGIIATRSNTIYELAKAILQKKINFQLCASPETEMKKLLAIRGIGDWTAQYIAMRTMEWPDAFLETDAGIKHALPGYSSKELLALAEAWRPWRSYATVNLWNTL